MSAAKFTPGPWRAEALGMHFIIKAKDSPVGIYAPGLASVGFANAALIAAAPELFEALEGLMADDSPVWAWVTEKNMGCKEYDRRSAVVEIARAALAKAVQS